MLNACSQPLGSPIFEQSNATRKPSGHHLAPRQSGGLPSHPPPVRLTSRSKLLKALHILTVDGQDESGLRRKLKQVYHLTQFIEPLIAHTVAERGRVNLVDHGAGKSYSASSCMIWCSSHTTSHTTCTALRRERRWWSFRGRSLRAAGSP